MVLCAFQQTRKIVTAFTLMLLGTSGLLSPALAQQEECGGLLSRIFSKAHQYGGETVEERMKENRRRAMISDSFSSQNDATVSYLQFVFRAFPHTLSPRPPKGGTLVEQGRNIFKPKGEEFDRAMELFGKAIEEGGDPSLVFQAYKYRGIAHYMKRKTNQAMEDLDNAIIMGISGKEDLREVYLFRALTKILLSDNVGIIKDLGKVLPTDDPRFAVAYYLRAPYYVAEGEIGKAIEDYAQLLKIHPKDALAHFQLAKLQTLLKRPEAIEHYRVALKGLGKEYNLHLFHGYALSLHGFLPEALGHVNRAVNLSPKDPRGLYLRSFVKKALGDTEGSKKDLGMALLLNPSIGEWSLLTDDQFLHFLEL